MSSPPAKNSGPLREALVSETLVAIEEVGLAAFNLRLLASRLGVSQPAMYRHFSSREDLLTAAMLAGWRRFDARVEGEAGDDEPYGRLHRLGLCYVGAGVEAPGWFRLVFGRRDVMERLTAIPDVPYTLQHLALAALARVVPPDHPDFGPSYRAWWGLVHGLTFLTIERVFVLVSDDEARLRAASEAIRVHLEGLRAHWGEPAAPTELTFEALFTRMVPRDGRRGA